MYIKRNDNYFLNNLCFILNKNRTLKVNQPLKFKAKIQPNICPQSVHRASPETANDSYLSLLHSQSQSLRHRRSICLTRRTQPLTLSSTKNHFKRKRNSKIFHPNHQITNNNKTRTWYTTAIAKIGSAEQKI